MKQSLHKGYGSLCAALYHTIQWPVWKLQVDGGSAVYGFCIRTLHILVISAICCTAAVTNIPIRLVQWRFQNLIHTPPRWCSKYRLY